MQTLIKSSRSRSAAPLDAKLDKKLLAYVAVGAAAVTGSAQFAESKVIYTPANTVIEGGATVGIDLNNDGVVDFNLVRCFCGAHSTWLFAKPAAAGNGIRPVDSFGAAAGFFGVPVGPGEKFSNIGSAYSGFMADQGSYGGTGGWFQGPWANAKNRYLGLKFLVNNQVHYGWARLTVTSLFENGAVLTGYAYESTPNTAIKEGYVGGPVESEESEAEYSPQASTLGSLARGAETLQPWRRLQ
jgi:hypothetical protein